MVHALQVLVSVHVCPSSLSRLGGGDNPGLKIKARVNVFVLNQHFAIGVLRDHLTLTHSMYLIIPVLNN